MRKNISLYESENHQFIFLNESEPGEEDGIPSNQFLILHNGSGTLLDPGGFGVMPKVLNELLQYIKPDAIEAMVLSHQDPDIVGGLTTWLRLTPAQVYVSKIWQRFLPHYGITGMERFIGIQDGGETRVFSSGLELQFIPAHFLHSPGQINVYDPESKILFTGDIGASEVPPGHDELFIKNFQNHLAYTEWFHKRYMASNRALRYWVQQVRQLDIEMIAPQHGPLYKGQAKTDLLDWLYDLECGSDLFLLR